MPKRGVKEYADGNEKYNKLILIVPAILVSCILLLVILHYV